MSIAISIPLTRVAVFTIRNADGAETRTPVFPEIEMDPCLLASETLSFILLPLLNGIL